MNLFRCKPIKQLLEEEENSQSLKRVLNGFHLILLGIGCIVGTGIFVLTGTAAAEHAGPALAISFIISGLGCLCSGLCYAEFASMIPLSGSVTVMRMPRSGSSSPGLSDGISSWSTWWVRPPLRPAGLAMQ